MSDSNEPGADETNQKIHDDSSGSSEKNKPKDHARKKSRQPSQNNQQSQPQPQGNQQYPQGQPQPYVNQQYPQGQPQPYVNQQYPQGQPQPYVNQQYPQGQPQPYVNQQYPQGQPQPYVNQQYPQGQPQPYVNQQYPQGQPQPYGNYGPPPAPGQVPYCPQPPLGPAQQPPANTNIPNQQQNTYYNAAAPAAPAAPQNLVSGIAANFLGRPSELWNVTVPHCQDPKYKDLWYSETQFLPHNIINPMGNYKFQCIDMGWAIAGLIFFVAWFGYSVGVISLYNSYNSLLTGFGIPYFFVNTYSTELELNDLTMSKWLAPFYYKTNIEIHANTFTEDSGIYVYAAFLLSTFEVCLAFLWPNGYIKWGRYLLMLIIVISCIPSLVNCLIYPAFFGILTVFSLFCIGKFELRETAGAAFIKVASKVFWAYPFATAIVFFVQTLLFQGLWAIFWYALTDSIFLNYYYFGAIFVFLAGLWTFGGYVRLCSMVDMHLFASYYFLKGTAYSISDWKVLFNILKRCFLCSQGSNWPMNAVSYPYAMHYCAVYGVPFAAAKERAESVVKKTAKISEFLKKVKIDKMTSLYPQTFATIGFIIGVARSLRPLPGIIDFRFGDRAYSFFLSDILFKGMSGFANIEILCCFGQMIYKNFIYSTIVCSIEWPHRLFELCPEEYNDIQTGIDVAFSINRPPKVVV